MLSTTAKKEEMLMWVLQSVIAFRYCEEMRICHLDIKPQNMVFKDGILRVIDLGSSAKFKLRAEVTSPVRDYAKVFHDKTRLYTPPELLPETIDPEVASSTLLASKVDVYCWGITFYLLLTGMSTAELNSLREGQAKITEKEYNEGFLAEVKARKELREFTPKVNMAEIIAACLRYNSSERCSFEQIEQWLEPISEFTYRTSEEAAEMYLEIGGAYNFVVGSKTSSLRYLQKSLDMKNKSGSDFATLRRCMGMVSSSTCDNEKALEYYKKVLDIQQKTPGLEHTEVARTCVFLGIAYADSGDLANAKKFILNGTGILENTLGPEHPVTAFAYDGVGHLYTCTGNYRKALEYVNKAYEVVKNLDEYKMSAMAVCDHLGRVHFLLCNYKKALEYHENALKTKIEAFGVEHQSVASTYQDIGIDYFMMLDYDNALKYDNMAIEIKRKIYGPDHVITAMSYSRIAEVYQSLGKRDKAFDFINKSLDINKTLFGTEHVNTAAIYLDLGNYYAIDGNNEKALEYHKMGAKIVKETYGPKHPDTATAYKSIGTDLFYLTRYAECLHYSRMALEVEESVLSDRNIGIVTTYNLVGSCYLIQRRKKDAARYFQKAVEKCEQIMGSMDQETGREYFRIGDFYYDTKNYGEALKYHMRVLEIWEKVLGPKHQYTIKAHNSVVQDFQRLVAAVQHVMRLVFLNPQIEAVPEQENAHDKK